MYCTSPEGEREREHAHVNERQSARERQSAYVDERERVCEYGQKCRRDTKTLFDHEAQCYCTILWFISEVHELQCRLDSLLTEWQLTHMNGSNAGWMRIGGSTLHPSRVWSVCILTGLHFDNATMIIWSLVASLACVQVPSLSLQFS